MAEGGLLFEFVDIVRQRMPELVLFLSLGIGYLIGKIKIGPVQIGGIAGTLIAALVIGQLGFEINPSVKSLFFALFIFALGYAGGPQFFANLNLNTLRLGFLSVIEVVSVFIIVLTAAYIFHFDAGTAAGLVAGAATESAVIGTASDAIARLTLSTDEIRIMQSNIATAYSVTYLFGVLAIVMFTSQLAPMLLRVNLRDEAEKLWRSMGGLNDDDDEENSENISSAVYKATFAQGKTIAQIYDLLGNKVRIEKLLRNGGELPIDMGIEIKKGDLALLIGDPAKIANAACLFGVEYTDVEKFNFIVGHQEAVLTNKVLIGQPLEKLQKDLMLSELLQGVYITGVKRAGHWLPLHGIKLAYGDIIRFYGKPQAIDNAAALAGSPIRVSDRTNLVFTSAGIVAGILLGSLGFHAAGIFVTLGTGGGVLVIGLICGWYQSKHPDIPGIPPSAVEIMKDMGLSLFIACVGVSAGPAAIQLIMQYGIILPLVGICTTLIPAIISLFVGRYILKLEIPILLGGIAGQQCSTPAVTAVQSAAGNSTPILGYTITYALSNVLLPLLGPILVSAVNLIK